MSDIAIKVEGLSKQYQLGQIGTGTLHRDLKRWWYTIRGKEDPFAKIGQVNDRTKKAESDFVWALKDIDFEVKKGEVLGIIGRNGAGKSTLLKILSKITAPTTGQIAVNGRIASLLEVGTGFHPELTGRENIFLNGAILGMRKWEIQKKFDEIVDFSGVEAYIDTPVKRYSSGMYVRLAFAVAAFLEPEILVVDEVLAVGDAEFQKKCLGRMKDVSVNDGRTVLFVSHNIGAINRLCDKGVLLKNGILSSSGNISEVVRSYTSNDLLGVLRNELDGELNWFKNNAPGTSKCRLYSVRVVQNEQKTTRIDSAFQFKVEVEYELFEDLEDFSIAINIHNSNQDIIIHSADIFAFDADSHFPRKKGIHRSSCFFQENILNVGNYFLSVSADIPAKEEFFYLFSIIQLKVETTSIKSGKYNPNQWRGVISPELLEWKYTNV